MIANVWLNNDRELLPGTEIFRSDRRFFLEAYSGSHSQLLFRSVAGQEHETTIDLLFKPVNAIKVQDVYQGLAIRCATSREAEEIDGASPDDRIFLLESQGRVDYIVSAAVGWREDVLERTRHSLFNSADAYQPRWPDQPLFGVNPGFNVASARDLIEALGADDRERPRRDRYRMVYVLLAESSPGDRAIGSGVFLSIEDAEEALALLAPKMGTDCWIETLPIAV